MPIDVIVPPLGATVDTLTLISWYKQEGETVMKDEPLFAVETDKATLDVESPASGILCRVGAQPGAEVVALTRIAMILSPAEFAEAGPHPNPAVETAAGKAQSRPAPTRPHPNPSPNFGRGAIGSPHTRNLSSPSQGEAQARAMAPSLLQGEGRGEGRNFRSPRAQDIPPSPRIGRGGQGGEGARIFISPRARWLAEERQIDWQALQGTGPEGAIVERDVLAFLERETPGTISPLARRMAEEAGLDWTLLLGAGPRGRVVREDVIRAISAREQAMAEPASAEADEDVLEILPVTGIRAVIASRMTQSFAETAPVTLTTETDATHLAALRAGLLAEGLAVSYNDLLLQILARALREHPRLNASWQGEVIKVMRRVHIGLAVDSDQGLRVPVVQDVDRKGLAEIAQETAALVERARQGRLRPEAMRGGTFTLTNLGMYGIDAFTPVINLPECAILGVGRIKPQPSVVEGQVVVRQKMWLSLTFDHRLVDGGPAARFLQSVAQHIENPYPGSATDREEPTQG